ncbi:CoA-binding protein [Clostridium sardiniense]|uniref:CoA-binding protein n=1 Tax=Clostridium sardiniense TaxID=29369 RepID=UPI003D3544D7
MTTKDITSFKNWVVIGDITNSEKYAYKILKKFKDKDYNVSGVYPKGGDNVYKSLHDVPYKIDAIDLCINPKDGLKFIEEAKEVGIENVLIQPGAESAQILQYCKDNDIKSIQGCALVKLGR